MNAPGRLAASAAVLGQPRQRGSSTDLACAACARALRAPPVTYRCVGLAPWAGGIARNFVERAVLDISGQVMAEVTTVRRLRESHLYGEQRASEQMSLQSGALCGNSSRFDRFGCLCLDMNFPFRLTSVSVPVSLSLSPSLALSLFMSLSFSLSLWEGLSLVRHGSNVAGIACACHRSSVVTLAAHSPCLRSDQRQTPL